MPVGLDIGYSNLKLEFSVGHGEISQVFPAGAAPVEYLPVGASSSRSDEEIITINDREYAVCVDHSRLPDFPRSLNQNYSETETYNALYRAALRKTGVNHINCLVTGLPVSQALKRETRDKLQKSLSGKIEITPSDSVQVDNVMVVPQPYGGYLYAASEAEDAKAFVESRTLVIDPGHYSVDWVTISNREIYRMGSGSSHRASSILLETAANLIREKKHINIRPDDIERALRNKRDEIASGGRWIKINPFIDRAAKQVAPLALSEMMSKARDSVAEAEIVVLVGGGARFYEEAAKEIFNNSQIFIPEDPISANARGFLIWAEHRMSKAAA
ncbi:MAG: ParM/StbA family protein [Aestuariibacter sp.]|nr:ParM/StbA family protein [Aestuariibacter sp.]